MSVYEFDPREDPRWAALVQSHPQSSIFHTVEWLDALTRTYGYASAGFTTSPPNEAFTNGIVFCRVNSWLTGSRLVSLPFSDHCDPLVRDEPDVDPLISAVRKKASAHKYAEIRPRFVDLKTNSEMTSGAEHYFHSLDLRPSIEELHAALHKDSIQRKIRRADRERVVLDQGRSDELLEEFYALLLLTRRRHGLPPQPMAWFRNLVSSFGDRLTIRVARVDGRPIGGILTLRHKQTLVYKYGCSDARFHNLGAMPRLFWQAILEAKSDGVMELDLGRSDINNPGLVRFKDHLGANRMILKYWRWSRRPKPSRLNTLHGGIPGKLMAHLPDPLFRLAGEFFYRHAG